MALLRKVWSVNDESRTLIYHQRDEKDDVSLRAIGVFRTSELPQIGVTNFRILLTKIR